MGLGIMTIPESNCPFSASAIDICQHTSDWSKETSCAADSTWILKPVLIGFGFQCTSDRRAVAQSSVTSTPSPRAQGTHFSQKHTYAQNECQLETCWTVVDTNHRERFDVHTASQIAPECYCEKNGNAPYTDDDTNKNTRIECIGI